MSDSLPGLRTVFQPIVALTTGEVLGYEALSRFPGSVLGRSEQFAVAWAEGVGPQLEAAAVRSARAVADRPAGTYVSVNISPSALQSEVIWEALDGDLSGIVVEVTEHADVPGRVLADPVRELRQRGARIAIDDVGAAFAGLQRLAELQPDLVKVDQSLIRDIDASTVKQSLLTGLVVYAERSGATLCAEGIEQPAELRTVADLDVPLGQGYLLGRPAPTWETVDPFAGSACRTFTEEALAGRPTVSVAPGSDDRMRELSAMLASTRTVHELVGCFDHVAALLAADDAVVSILDNDSASLRAVEHGTWDLERESYALNDYPLTERVMRDQIVATVRADSGSADRHEAALLRKLGFRTLLMLPVVSRGASVALLEVYRSGPAPWTRTEIVRARTAANQLGLAIAALHLPRS